MFTQASLIETLKSGQHKVLFIKNDGSIRTIVGSLPADATPRNETAVPIVEAGSGAWKSFTVASVIEVAAA